LQDDSSPLVGGPPTEVPLPQAPLVRVIAQVRFPLILSIQKQEYISPFQEAIRALYPVLRLEQNQGVMLGDAGVVGTRSSQVWRFHDSSEGWRVSLATDFLALETTNYTSRDDFIGRFELLLRAMQEHLTPGTIDRLGVRYIDQIVGPNLDDLGSLIRPEVCGVSASPLASQTQHAVTECVFELPDEQGNLKARWGNLPKNGTIDPGVLRPIDQHSWILDLDAYTREQHSFDIDGIVEKTRSLAQRAYCVFRWAVTDEFLRRYGGDVGT
jgi:uncharacterized protein (TIGR04255 family)